MTRMKRRTGIYCSFCGRHHSEVCTLVAGIDVFICDNCVAQAQAKIANEQRALGMKPALVTLG